MGYLVEGKWQTGSCGAAPKSASLHRSESSFRHWVTSDGAAGSTGDAGFHVERGRYHLYVSLACPLSHRVLILHTLKKLGSIISISTVNAFVGDAGWSFAEGEGLVGDSVNQKNHVHELYTLAMPNYTGNVSLPLLWDKQKAKIVSNDPDDILHMLNSAFDDVGAVDDDYYPEHKRDDIDALNDWLNAGLSDRIDSAGFATTQHEYQAAINDIFNVLDSLEQRLERQRYLSGSELALADWCLFTVLLRFDTVYVNLFKCNRKRIVDYPTILAYVRDLFQHPSIEATVDIEHIKSHYYVSYKGINPTGIIPIGPKVDFLAAHHRSHLNSEAEGA